METRFFVTLHPGFYGDRSSVLSSHRTIKAAQDAARLMSCATLLCVVRQGARKKGDDFFRADESFYPVIPRFAEVER